MQFLVRFIAQVIVLIQIVRFQIPQDFCLDTLPALLEDPLYWQNCQGHHYNHLKKDTFFGHNAFFVSQHMKRYRCALKFRAVFLSDILTIFKNPSIEKMKN